MSESEEVLAVKFCFHCGRLLSDEVARLGDEVVDIDDFLEAINLTLSEDEVPYFCFNCNILYIVNFDERYCKWIDTNEKKSGSKHMQKDYKKCLHGRKEVKIWGRKKKYLAKICKDCHLLLELEEISQK